MAQTGVKLVRMKLIFPAWAGSNETSVTRLMARVCQRHSKFVKRLSLSLLMYPSGSNKSERERDKKDRERKKRASSLCPLNLPINHYLHPKLFDRSSLVERFVWQEIRKSRLEDSATLTVTLLKRERKREREKRKDKKEKTIRDISLSSSTTPSFDYILFLGISSLDTRPLRFERRR